MPLPLPLPLSLMPGLTSPFSLFLSVAKWTPFFASPLYFIMHVCVRIPEGTPPPAEGEIKHVEFYGEDESTHRFKYKKAENTLFFEYLKSTGSSSYEQLMTVFFNMPMEEGEAMKFCENVLKRGIFCNPMYYNFLGHSDSQVRSRTCYFMNASEEGIRKHLEEFYDFFKITDVRLRAKKIGLLFSSFNQSLELSKNDWTVNEERSFLKQRTFTSGCGFMSREIVSKIGRKLGGVNYPESSAVLVRIQGFEGMLVLKEDKQRTNDQNSSEGHPKIQINKSMQKLTISKQPMSFICIVDRSRPHENAYLDAKLIMLLAAREVSVEYLKSLQKQYFRLLKNMCHDSASADYFLRLRGRSSNDNHVKEDLPALRRIEIKKMIDHVHDPDHEPPRRQIERIRILVRKARVVFGVCDPYNKLKYGECYFRPTLLHDDEQDFAAENEVFMARTPCYHPGDIRVLKLTHEKGGYENLKDCLVLPVEGQRPQSFECAGGDLGGSKFLVCWDPQLIPKTTVKPCSYSPTNSDVSPCLSSACFRLKRHHRKSTKEIREEMIKYFASFTDDLPSQIDKTYMNLVKSSGLSSKQCEQLSKMFYQATNSTVDRDALSKKLAEIEQREQTGSTSSVEEPFTEESGLLGETEEGEPALEVRGNDRHISGCISCQGVKDPPFDLNGKVLQQFEEEATRFVREAQQKHYCD